MAFSKLLLVLVVPVLLLAGCASPPEVRDVDASRLDQAVVFGRVVVVEDGKPQKLGMTLDGIDEFRLLVLPPGERVASVYPVAVNGKFFWGLTPGEYRLVGYEYNKQTAIRRDRLWLSFSVPANAKSLYIGDLHLIILDGRYITAIKDDFAAAVEAYQGQFPEGGDIPEKTLLHTEEAPGTYESVEHICAEGWGIQCTRSYLGVIPIEPTASATKPAKLDNLRPRFEWQPSTDPDVTYDLVIYEAIRYPRAATTQYMPGRQVAYVEALEHPEFEMKSPLKPATRYFWSVRLRRDKTVTSWSTYGYFHFYVVAWTSGHGQWLSFVTPDR